MSTFDKSIVLRGFNNYDTDSASLSSGSTNVEPSLAVQSELQDTDINYIVRQFGITGALPNGDIRMPSYGDFTTQVTDYQSALNLLLDADESFMSLSADVRKRFDNSPAKLLDFLNDSDNMDEAVKLGLVNGKPAPDSGTESGDGAQAET